MSVSSTSTGAIDPDPTLPKLPDDRSSVPKILLLTGSPPGDKGVGQIIVREICRRLPMDRMVCFATLGRHEHWEPSTEFKDLKVQIARRRYEHRFEPVKGPLGNLTAYAAYWGMFRRHCDALTRRAVEFAKTHECETLFSILESTTNIQITDPIARGADLPKHVLVWDAPDYIATHLHQTPFDVDHVVSAFDQAMCDVSKLAVVSDAMAERYAATYGIESVMLRHVAPQAQTCRGADLNGDHFVIGFAGSVSARPQLDLLQQVLDRMNWRVAGRPVRLDLYGMRFVMEAQSGRTVLYHGYRSVEETVDRLAKTADVLFMPQPFEERLRSFSEFSFPTKLSTYFAAQRPILLLSPPYSTLGDYIRKHPFGVWCSSMDVESLTESLTKLGSDTELRQRAIGVIRRQLQVCFNSEYFSEQLKQFVSPKKDA